MSVEIVAMAPTLLASVKERVLWPELAKRIRGGFDRVWPYLRANGVVPSGHNVCVYRNMDRQGCELECGVQISAPIQEGDGVANSATPSGRAAHIVHMGAYDQLHKLGAEFEAAVGAGAGVHWEVYGDWTEDVTQLRTDVYRLI